jgi:hypothetical protein
MTNHSIEDTLKTLSYLQALVLYWTCEGLSNENIAARYGYTKSWVVWQMSFVYHKLGIDRKDERTGKSLHWTRRRDIIRERVCPVLRRLINNDPDNLEIFPIIPPNVIEGSIEDFPPETQTPPSEIPVPPPEPLPEPPPLPEPGEIPPPEPPPDFYPVELYKAWLMVLEDDAHGPTGDSTPPPPVYIAPERRGPRWGRLLSLGLAVLLGCIAMGALAYWLGTQRNAPPATPILASATQEILITETLAQTATITVTLLPTETLAPTMTPTPPSLTPIATDTKSPIGLVKGDELSNNSVTLKFKEFKFQQGRTRVGQRPIAQAVFEFDFTNHSGDTILLQIGPDKFRAEDNLGNKLTCDFWNGVTEAVETIQRPLENGQTFRIGVYCGEGQVPSDVTEYTLFVTNFSSLTDSTWIAKVIR